MRKLNRKANQAAIVIAIITVLIILYILFLPPNVREDLLNENSDGSSTTDSLNNKTLFTERVGRIDAINTRSRDHALNSFSIYSITESKQLAIVDSIYIKNSLFGNEFGKTTFVANEPKAQNFLLTFNAEQHDGRLIIELNGQAIFDRTITTYNPEPINLDKSLLRATNELVFKTDSAGFAFWRTHEYLLKNVQIIADITDNSKSFNEQKFYISEEERNNLDKATLYFYPRCSNNPGPIGIDINAVNVFYGLPDCDILNNIIVENGVIASGINTLKFSGSEGKYIIDNVKIKTDLKKALNPIFYYDAEDKLFSHIDEDTPDYSEVSGKYNIYIKFRFTNPYDDKRAEVLINGHKFYMSTIKQTYTKNIENYTIPGSNSIEIIPDTSFDVAELKVFVETTKT
jgi:hypothetical protein